MRGRFYVIRQRAFEIALCVKQSIEVGLPIKPALHGAREVENVIGVGNGAHHYHIQVASQKGGQRWRVLPRRSKYLWTPTLQDVL